MMQDYSYTLQEQEEMHFYSCISDVTETFLSHGVKNILFEITKNPEFRKQIVEYFQNLETEIK